MFRKKDKNREETYTNQIETVVLRTINDRYELDIVENLLEDNKIPYMLKEKGTGGYMKIISGSSLYGTDVLVETSQFEKAKAILDEFPWQD